MPWVSCPEFEATKAEWKLKQWLRCQTHESENSMKQLKRQTSLISSHCGNGPNWTKSIQTQTHISKLKKIWGIKWFSPNIFFFINTILQHHLHVTFHLLSVLSNNDGEWREMFTCVLYPHYIVYSVYVHMCLKVSGEMAHYAIQFMVSPN